MSLTHQLVFFATMGQTADPWTETDYVGGNHLLAPNGASSVLGQFDRPAIHLDRSLIQSLQHSDAQAFRIAEEFTLAVRVKFTRLSSGDSAYVVAQRGVTPFGPFDYQFGISWNGSGWTLNAALNCLTGGFPVVLTASQVTTIAVDEWHVLSFSWDGVGTISVSVDGGTPSTQSLASTSINPAGVIFSVGAAEATQASRLPMEGDLQDLAIWHRLLSVDELLSFVSGASFPFTPPEVHCLTTPCCPDPLAADPYNASTPSASGTSNSGQLCIPTPVITIDPPSGTTVAFPSYVFLHVSRPDAVIYYTTDGSVPTTESTVYTAPFQVTNPTDVIRAFAQVEGCAPGSPITAQYVRYGTTFKFGYSCNTTDKMGQWGNFSANGSPDLHWTLQISFPASTDIKRMELYQTNAIGVWNSGQAWSTQEFINPIEGPPNFHVFPLGVFDDGLGLNLAFSFVHQINTAYSTDFGTYAAQQYLWTLIGQPVIVANGFFKLLVFLSDGTVLESIINHTCGDPPPPCPGPTVPTLTPTCTGIDVVVAETVGKSYFIYRGTGAPCGDGVLRLLLSGTIATNPQTFHDTGLVDGCVYCYALYIDEGVCGIQTNGVVCGSKLFLPTASISVTPSVIDPGDTVTINWTSNHTTGNISVIKEASACEGQSTIYGSTGNASGSATSIVNCDTCFKITASNSCGDAVAEACVTVRGPANCVGGLANKYALSGYSPTSTFFDVSGCPGIFAGSWIGTWPAWDGTVSAGAQADPCSWSNQSAACELWTDSGKYLVNITVAFLVDRWILSIGYCGEDVTTVWSGHKLFGSSPIGTYHRVTGCSSTPATLDIVAV